MILDRLIRSYFEQNGSFKGIENTFFYDRIKDRDLYETLGFAPVDKYTSKQVYELNKKYVLGELSEKEIETLKRKDVLGKFSTRQHPLDDIENVDLVKLVAHYIKYTQNTISFDGENATQFMFYASKLALAKDAKEMSEALKSPLLKHCTKALDIKIGERSDKCFINNGILHCDRQITTAQKNKIIKNAVLEALYNITELSLTARVELLNLVNENIVKLAEQDINKYKSVLLLAVRVNKTVKDLCELAGINYIDTIEQIETMGVSVNIHTLTSVKLYTIDSTEDDFVIVNNDDFKMLYERNLLSTIEWEDNLAVVTAPHPVKLHNLLLCRISRDLRR